MNVYALSFSGGLDSTTTLYHIIKNMNKDDHILVVNFEYGQINEVEKYCAFEIISKLKKTVKNLEYITVDLNLTFNQIDTKLSRDSLEFYFPFRNLIFASVLGSLAEKHVLVNKFNVDTIFISLGLHKHTSYENYWDITSDFANQLQNVLDLNTSYQFKLYLPFINKTKSDIVREARKLGVPINKTWTCYDPIFLKNEDVIVSCLQCESCLERMIHSSKEETITSVSLSKFKKFKEGQHATK